MHIKEVKITNIRSIQNLHMRFQQPAGWHVILGDNGSGKSSIIRAISAAIVGPSETLRLDPDFDSWVTRGQSKATIDLHLTKHLSDKRSGKGGAKGGVKDVSEIKCSTYIQQDEGNGRTWKFKDASLKNGTHPDWYNWGSGEGWFSAAFGPYRRFNGGNQSLESFYVRNPKIGAHLTAFKDDAALTESVVWLKDLLLRSLSKLKAKEANILEGIKHFINQQDLLPQGFKLEELTPDGPFFLVPGGYRIHLYELSEGIKSVTSLAFELLRLLLDTYDSEEVFSHYLDSNPNNNFIPVPGIVMIDEIDVHLHPIWQARIGHWFTRSFPNIQFIVTTHSPLACRAASKGTVWRLPNPEDIENDPYQVQGDALQKLLYGDILDAYDTQAFGIGITRDPAGHKLLEQLAELNIKYLTNKVSESEKIRRNELLKLFPTDDAFTK